MWSFQIEQVLTKCLFPSVTEERSGYSRPVWVFSSGLPPVYTHLFQVSYLFPVPTLNKWGGQGESQSTACRMELRNPDVLGDGPMWVKGEHRFPLFLFSYCCGWGIPLFGARWVEGTHHYKVIPQIYISHDFLHSSAWIWITILKVYIQQITERKKENWLWMIEEWGREFNNQVKALPFASWQIM